MPILMLPTSSRRQAGRGSAAEPLRLLLVPAAYSAESAYTNMPVPVGPPGRAVGPGPAATRTPPSRRVRECDSESPDSETGGRTGWCQCPRGLSSITTLPREYSQPPVVFNLRAADQSLRTSTLLSRCSGACGCPL